MESEPEKRALARMKYHLGDCNRCLVALDQGQLDRMCANGREEWNTVLVLALLHRKPSPRRARKGA